MVYVMHITSIYLLYDNNNLPGPCTLTHPVFAPGTQHQPAWTEVGHMGHESFQHCLCIGDIKTSFIMNVWHVVL